ncbi:cyclic peptide export ABC transporter [Burkholderia stagnalis]
MANENVDNSTIGFRAELIRLLGPLWPVTLVSTVLGVASGLGTGWLLALVNEGLHTSGPISWRAGLAFVALCVATLLGNALAGIGNSVVGQRVIARLRKDISARVVCAPIAEIERFRVHRLMATLNSDVDTVSAFTFNFPGYAVAFAISLGCIAYMVVLSPLLSGFAAVAIVLGIAINHYASSRWSFHYRGVRAATDDLQKQYRAITEGAKELRINQQRRTLVYDRQLSGAADTISELKIRAMRLFYAAGAAGTTLFFLVIGLILAFQHQLGVDSRVVSGFVIVLLYIRGPVDQLVEGLPAWSQAQVSFRRIAELSAQFRNREPHLLIDGAPAVPATIGKIELKHARYAFPQVGDVKPFVLGPVDLTIDEGEILFVIGENGCGKTTLIKLLLGLYTPTEGALYLNGRTVDVAELDGYRQLFSAVFSDYYLFDDLVARDPALLSQARRYLELLEIGHKVEIKDGAFSTIDLSAGQRKRLALVHAMLEQRPIMMFDEWAADQDPTFRRVFYTEFLPELKRQGKTLIVVSHDDRYFDVADRVIRLENGRIIQSADGASFRYEDRAPRGGAAVVLADDIPGKT